MQVFIVSGGGTLDFWNTGDYLVVSSTETWTPGPTVSAWIPAADLPSPRGSLAGVSIGGQFLVIGEQEQCTMYNVVNNDMLCIFRGLGQHQQVV